MKCYQMKIWKIKKTASDLTGAKRHQDLTRSAPLHDLHQMQQRGVSSPGTLKFAKSTRLNPNPIGGNVPYINALKIAHFRRWTSLQLWSFTRQDLAPAYQRYTLLDIQRRSKICHSSVYHGYTKVIDVQDQRDQRSKIPTRERVTQSDSEWLVLVIVHLIAGLVTTIVSIRAMLQQGLDVHDVQFQNAWK